MSTRLALSVDHHHPYFSTTSTSGTPTDPEGGFTCSLAASVAAMSYGVTGRETAAALIPPPAKTTGTKVS